MAEKQRQPDASRTSTALVPYQSKVPSVIPSLGNLDAYIQAANRFPILSYEEEQNLVKRLHENNDMQAKVVATFKNAESLITGATKEPLAENQNLFLIVDASVNKEGITDIKTFCETRGIDATSVQKIGRLLAFSEELLTQTWENHEELQEEMRQDPLILASLCAKIEKGLEANQSRGGRR